MMSKFYYYGCRTVATLGALEGGARSEGVGGIGPKVRSLATLYIKFAGLEEITTKIELWERF
jgi:hypothetical protein